MRKQLKRAGTVARWAERVVGLPGLLTDTGEWKRWIHAVPRLQWLAAPGLFEWVRRMANSWEWGLLIASLALLLLPMRAGIRLARNQAPKPRSWLDRAAANEIMINSSLVTEPPPDDYSRYDAGEWADLQDYRNQQANERMLMHLEDFKLEHPEAVEGDRFGSPTLQWWIAKKVAERAGNQPDRTHHD